MKTFAAICAPLILSMITEGVEGNWQWSTRKLVVGTPAFRDTPGGFYDVPVNKYSPWFRHYVRVEIEVCYPVELYCLPNDPIYCLFMDLLGNLAGVHIGFPKKYAKDIDPNIYNFSNNTNYVDIEIFGEPLWAVWIWYTDIEALTFSGRSDVNEIIEGLWTYIGEELVRFDQRCQPTGPSIGDFDLQGCVPMKGTLYVHQFNKYSSCQGGFFLFLVYDLQTLVGFGVAAPGHYLPCSTREWYDYPQGERLATIVPSPPKCFNDVIQYGLTSIVTFLIDEPYNINCPVCGC